MKTRTFNLPLVIFCILIGNNKIYAQKIVHITLMEYFAAIQNSPAFPTDAALASSNPETYEGHGDLNAFEEKLKKAVKVEEVAEESMHRLHAKPIPLYEETAAIKEEYRTLLASVKQMQSVKVEFEGNF